MNNINKCVKYNYIPDKTPIFKNYYIWKETYNDYLIELYNIFKNSFYNNYTYENIWDDDIMFDKYCIFIWNCSSKYIIKY
jgi:hypothetical protein